MFGKNRDFTTKFVQMHILWTPPPWWWLWSLGTRKGRCYIIFLLPLSICQSITINIIQYNISHTGSTRNHWIVTVRVSYNIISRHPIFKRYLKNVYRSVWFVWFVENRKRHSVFDEKDNVKRGLVSSIVHSTFYSEQILCIKCNPFFNVLYICLLTSWNFDIIEDITFDYILFKVY